MEVTLPDKIWADLNSSECQVLAVYQKKSIIIPKFFTVLAFTHMLPFVSSSTLQRSDDFVKFSPILRFEGWLSLHIRKTRLILPAETSKFLKLLAKWIMLNGRNYTLGMWTAKRGKLHLLQISLYQMISIINKVGKEIWNFIRNEFFNFIIKSLFFLKLILTPRFYLY